jgi:hypothetical protein
MNISFHQSMQTRPPGLWKEIWVRDLKRTKSDKLEQNLKGSDDGVYTQKHRVWELCPLHLETETDPISETLCFLVISNSGR